MNIPNSFNSCLSFATGDSVRFYFQKGAAREKTMEYPNPLWGYGRLDLYHMFEIIN